MRIANIVRTRLGWAVTNPEEGLLAHFPGLEGYEAAEAFAVAWMRGEVEADPDPLPRELRERLDGAGMP